MTGVVPEWVVRWLKSGGLGDGLVIAMAIWTVVCNACVLVGGGLGHAMVVFGIVLAAWLAGNSMSRFRGGPGEESLVASSGGDSGPSSDGARESRFQEYLVLGLVVLAVVITMIAHKPDQDDCQWISWSEWAVANPWKPVLAVNTMNAPPWTPIVPSSYRFHSLELAAAAASLVAFLPSIVIFHMVFAPIAAAMAVYSYRRLMRLLVPRYWGPGVLAVMVYLLASGETNHSWGNFGFVRLHQAKGIMVTVVLPMILVYALRWARRPTVKGWVLLAASQIVALGLSFSALFVAPPIAVLGVFAGLEGASRPERWRRMVTGTASSAYLIAVGIGLRLLASDVSGFLPDVTVEGVASRGVGTLMLSILRDALQVFGGPRSVVVALVVLLTACTVVRHAPAVRVFRTFVVGLLLFFVNPIAMAFMVKFVTGLSLYWRLFWILPFPAIVATVVVQPLESDVFRRSPWKRIAACGGILAVVASLSTRPTLASSNRVRIDSPSLKAGVAREVAGAIVDLIAESHREPRLVLGPTAVTAWIPTFPGHPYPLVARNIYAYTLGADRARRMALKTFITRGGAPGEDPAGLAEGLRDYEISCVCLPTRNPSRSLIRDILLGEGFVCERSPPGFEIWIDRSDAVGRPEHSGRL